jgi:hypothetical protein
MGGEDQGRAGCGQTAAGRRPPRQLSLQRLHLERSWLPRPARRGMRAASAAPARATRHGRGQAVHPSELSAPRRGRARLDAALHRLQTNMSVLREGGGGGRGSPRTVEMSWRAPRARVTPPLQSTRRQTPLRRRRRPRRARAAQTRRGAASRGSWLDRGPARNGRPPRLQAGARVAPLPPKAETATARGRAAPPAPAGQAAALAEGAAMRRWSYLTQRVRADPRT